MHSCTSLAVILTLFSSVLTWAAPSTLTYQGRIVRDDGTPLEYVSVSFAFTIMNASGNCVLYREQRDNVNMQGSKGVFDVPIGSGTKLFPNSPTFKLNDAFNNSVVQNCEGGATYTPAANDIRLLAVQFHDGVGWKAITPNSEIRSVPFASFADSANKLGDKLPTDFILKNSISACGVGQYLTFDGTNFSCQTDAGGAGMVSDVNVTAPLTKSGTTSLPTLGVSIGSTAGTVAAGDDARFGNALNIQSVPVSNAAPSSNQILKFNAGSWAPATIAISDITGLQTSLNNKVDATMFPTSCTAGQSLVFVTPANKFDCYSIQITETQITGTISGTKINGNISGNAAGFTGSLAGDVSGTQSATSVDKIKGVAVDGTAPTAGQVLKYVAGKWTPAADSSNVGTVTSVTGTAGQIAVTNSTSTPVLSLENVGTAGSYYKVTTDAQGRVVSGNTTLVEADIPTLNWIKLTGLPSTLAGYGISDAVKNTSGVPSMSAGTDSSKGAAGTAGRLFVATDTFKIYRDNGTGWDLIGSAVGSGGTVTSISGSLPVVVANGTSTPTISVNDASTSSKGVIQVGAGLSVTAGTVSVDPTSFPSLVPIAKGGTNSSTALVNNRVMISNANAIVEAPAITANKALISDANGIPTHSAVSSTEIGYVAGVNSSIQPQLDSKASSSGWTNFSVMGVNGSGALTAIPGSSSGSILNWTVSGPAWTTATFPTSTTANQLLYSSANNVVAGLATANNAILTTNGTGVPSWGSISSDVFSQYALLLGRTGGQTLYGGTAASNNLTLASTSNATKGYVLLNPAGGNVGIGTSAPTEVLSLKTASASRIKVETTSTTGTAQAYFLRGTAETSFGPDASTIDLWSSENLPFVVTLDGSNERFRIQPNGNVGIGTASPSSTLDVMGPATNDTKVITSRTNRNSVSSVIGKIGFSAYNNTPAAVDYAAIAGVIESNTAASESGALIFRTVASGTTAERVRISSSGSVGIGTSSPGSTLDVNGQIAGKSYKIRTFQAGGRSSGSCTLSSANGTNLPDQFCDLAVTFTLTDPASVQIAYTIAMTAGGANNGRHIVTGIDIDGTLVTTAISGITLQELTPFWGIGQTHFADLAAGTHTIKVRYRTPAGGTSNPSANDWENRLLQVVILGYQ